MNNSSPTQDRMFQNNHPEGQFICPCGETASGEYQDMFYHGWWGPRAIHHFKKEGQKVIALCPVCNLDTLKRQHSLWVIKPAEGEYLYQWLNRLFYDEVSSLF